MTDYFTFRRQRQFPIQHSFRSHSRMSDALQFDEVDKTNLAPIEHD
jgi:hypothetical protein